MKREEIPEKQEEIPTSLVEKGTSRTMDLDAKPPHVPAAESTRDKVEAQDTDKTATVTEGEKKLSKNQLKKLAKLQRFADTREQWKADKREKKKAAKQRKRELGSENGLKRKADGEEEEVGSRNGSIGGDVEPEPVKKKLKKTEVQPVRVLEPITFIMDCGFDEKMNDKVGWLLLVSYSGFLEC